jgi:nucleoside-diphosphate-sugar epimerase
MNVLFVGGTGIISSACAVRARDAGMQVTFLTRGTSFRAIPEGVRSLRADVRDASSVREAIGDEQFDVIVNWVAFTTQHIETDLSLFGDRTGQYVFISSASAYQTPLESLPITESTPLGNPYWAYSRDKIACEERLVRAWREDGFPVTIVRPSHTYDSTLLPLHGGWTIVDRMRRELPIIVHGDGTSLWVLTHHRDFAKGFVGLLGNSRAIGDVFQITSDEVLTWNRIATLIAEAAGTAAEIVHVPSDVIASYDAEWGDGLLGDKAHSVLFDNTKIRRLVPDYAATIPFSHGAREIVDWYDANPTRQIVDHELNDRIDRIIRAQRSTSLTLNR